jgi:hypothetical protein
MKQIDYDDSRLQQLFAELEPKRRLQAMRGAFRKEADRVRKVAVNNLRSSGLRSSKELEKGIRRVVSKKKAGFRVTVGTKRANKAGKGEAGFHTNRRGLKKPILIWAEDGTKERKTKNGGGILGFFTRRAARKRRAHRTGKMKRYGFMSRTLEGERESVTNNVRNNVVESIKKISEKYGCK